MGTNGAITGAVGGNQLAPVLAAHGQPTGLDNGHDSKGALAFTGGQEITRFMPVMGIEQAIARREAIVQATKLLMTEGVDYGKIPGSEKPSLLQPGADKLCNLFGLVIQYEVIEVIKDWKGEEHNGEPFFYYEVRGRAYRDGMLMGEGIGSCNSWEAKYRWRKAERVCPACGKENIRKSKQEEGWYCWVKTGGCGSTFSKGDLAIEGQETGRKPNPDIFDAVNTVQKMAFKRSKTSTTINATSASEFFTQDLEDFQLPGEEINTGGHPVGTQSAADYVAQQKLAAMKQPKPWATVGEMKRIFAQLREQLGETAYFTELEKFGVKEPGEFRKTEVALDCYRRLLSLREVA